MSALTASVNALSVNDEKVTTAVAPSKITTKTFMIKPPLSTNPYMPTAQKSIPCQLTYHSFKSVHIWIGDPVASTVSDGNGTDLPRFNGLACSYPHVNRYEGGKQIATSLLECMDDDETYSLQMASRISAKVGIPVFLSISVLGFEKSGDSSDFDSGVGLLPFAERGVIQAILEGREGGKE